MKTYAYYDKDGKIKKVISSTKHKWIMDNKKPDEQIMAVPMGTQKDMFKIQGNAIVPIQKIEVKPEPVEIDPEESIIEKEVGIHQMLPSNVDKWVDENVKDFDDVKSLLKQLVKVNAKRQFRRS